MDALRQFVRGGGTLIAFNNASNVVIDSFSLPVTNVLAGVRNEQFFCSGSLLRVELRDTSHPALWGMQREPVVFFERGPAFETKSGFRGAVLASYSRDRNPLASGYLLHPERIQGKAAALQVFYGDGRVYLFGFKPQWRGQAHGTYKMVFNTIYDSPAVGKPSAFQRAAEAPSPQADVLRGMTAKIHSEVAGLLRQNQDFFSARGSKALEERAKLSAAVDQFEKDGLAEIDDAAISLNDDAKRKAREYSRQLRSLAEDLRSKEFEAALSSDALLERYRVSALEQDLAAAAAKPK